MFQSTSDLPSLLLPPKDKVPEVEIDEQTKEEQDHKRECHHQNDELAEGDPNFRRPCSS